jgi:basic amino acid/polyamine antiporter, APA family
LKNQDEGLKRVIGVRSLTMMAINVTIGAGIFALPAVVAMQLGSSAIWAYLICGLLMVPTLLCFVELGTKITTSGGSYAYVEKAFGPLAGFLTNTLYWLGYAVMTDAALAIVMADNLATFFPALSVPLYRMVFPAILMGGLAVINVIGVKESSRFVVTIALIKITPLLLLIVVGLFYVDVDNFKSGNSFSVTNLGEASLILFYAFGGAESVLSATGEIKDPKKTIPRALILGVLMIFLIYVFIQIVAQGILGDTLASQSTAPLVGVAEKVFGQYGMMLLVASAAISCFGTISGDLLACSRIPYAAARDGLLPSYLAKLHPRFATPYRSIILYALVGLLLSVSGGFRQLAIMSSASLLLVYVGVITATIRLRNMKSENSFTIPGGLTVPVLAMMGTLWFLSNLAAREVMAVGLFLAFFTSVYFIMKKASSNNRQP